MLEVTLTLYILPVFSLPHNINSFGKAGRLQPLLRKANTSAGAIRLCVTHCVALTSPGIFLISVPMKWAETHVIY